MKKMIFVAIFVSLFCNTLFAEDVAWGKPQYFDIISDDDFMGYSAYYPELNKAIFSFQNYGDRAYRPKELVFNAWTKNGKKYILELTTLEKNDSPSRNYIINPNDIFLVTCQTPSALRHEDLNGFNVWVSRNKAIRFGYEKLSLLQKAWRPIYKELSPEHKEELKKLRKKLR